MSDSNQSNATQATSGDAAAFAEIRKIVISELRAEELSSGQQETLMKEVGEALLERATVVLLKEVPPEVLLELAEEDVDPEDPKNADAFLQKISPYVPNMQEILEREVKAGMQAYHEFLDKHKKV